MDKQKPYYYVADHSRSYPNRTAEIFKGIQYGRTDFAGTADTCEEALRVCALLNKESDELFYQAVLTNAALNDLKALTIDFKVEPYRWGTGESTIVPDLFKVTFP